MPKRKPVTNRHARTRKPVRRQSEKATVMPTTFPASAVTPGQHESRKAFNAFEIDHDQCAWWKDYLDLLDEGYTWRAAAYISWAASPVNGRWPETQRDLAQQVLGMKSDRAIRIWRVKYPQIDQRVRQLQIGPLLQHRRDVIEALITVASAADAQAHSDRKLFLEMTGDYRPRAGLAITGANEGPLELHVHDDDINAAIERELARMADRGQTPDAAEIAAENKSE